MGRGSNGKLPFIEINGEQIADSQIIIRRLAQKFNVQVSREIDTSRSYKQ